LKKCIHSLKFYFTRFIINLFILSNLVCFLEMEKDTGRQSLLILMNFFSYVGRVLCKLRRQRLHFSLSLHLQRHKFNFYHKFTFKIYIVFCWCIYQRIVLICFHCSRVATIKLWPIIGIVYLLLAWKKYFTLFPLEIIPIFHLYENVETSFKYLFPRKLFLHTYYQISFEIRVCNLPFKWLRNILVVS
jgi:hypothetical protein